MRNPLIWTVFLWLFNFSLFAQTENLSDLESVNVAGGDAFSTSGSISYSLGSIFCASISTSQLEFKEGVQQTYSESMNEIIEDPITEQEVVEEILDQEESTEEISQPDVIENTPEEPQGEMEPTEEQLIEQVTTEEIDEPQDIKTTEGTEEELIKETPQPEVIDTTPEDVQTETEPTEEIVGPEDEETGLVAQEEPTAEIFQPELVENTPEEPQAEMEPTGEQLTEQVSTEEMVEEQDEEVKASDQEEPTEEILQPEVIPNTSQQREEEIVPSQEPSAPSHEETVQDSTSNDDNLVFIAKDHVFNANYGEKDNTDTIEIVTYPNPVLDKLNITIKGYHNQLAWCELYDSQGRLLMQKNIKQNKTELSMLRLPDAQYILRVFVQRQGGYQSFTLLKK